MCQQEIGSVVPGGCQTKQGAKDIGSSEAGSQNLP